MTSQLSETFSSSEFKELRFEDGGLYCGGTRRGKAHGHGICTGPGGEGQYSGAWSEGFESSGSYVWPNSNVYYGQWMQGKRHGLGMEKRGHWVYQGEMTNGFMGKYGVKKDERSLSRYEGTWTNGVQCGYGMEMYSDEGTYVGQWLKGLRHGYGIRTSSSFEKSSTSPQATNAARKFSLTLARSEPEIVIKESDLDPKLPPSITDLFPPVPPPSKVKQHTNVKISPVNRIGFFLKGKSRDVQTNIESHNMALGVSKKFSDALKFGNKAFNENDESKTKQDFNKNLKVTTEKLNQENIGFENQLTGIMGTVCNPNNLLDVKSVPPESIEIYSGEWKYDKRCGYGVCHRSDGLKYEGEWSDNLKNGFGATTFSDGSREEGIYKNNYFQEPMKRLQMLKIGKPKEQVDTSVMSANKAAQIATQKAEIALSRAKTAVAKMELAIHVVDKSILDSKIAQCQLTAHLEQRKHNSAFKINEDILNSTQPKTPIILGESETSDVSNKVGPSSKLWSNIKRSESWQCISTFNSVLNPRNIGKYNEYNSSDSKTTNEENVSNFYVTNLVTFSEKLDKNETIMNMQRRSTMPSIVKYHPQDLSVQPSFTKRLKLQTIPEDYSGSNTDYSQFSSFVVQNGHKRLLSNNHTVTGEDELFEEMHWNDYLLKLTRNKLPSYKLQPKQWMSKEDIRSVPDVRYLNKWDTKVLDKERADNMCIKVRVEKQKLIEIEAELRKNSIVIKIGEIKAWFKYHFFGFFIFSLNTAIAIIFYNLLK